MDEDRIVTFDTDSDGPNLQLSLHYRNLFTKTTTCLSDTVILRISSEFPIMIKYPIGNFEIRWHLANSFLFPSSNNTMPCHTQYTCGERSAGGMLASDNRFSLPTLATTYRVVLPCVPRHDQIFHQDTSISHLGGPFTNLVHFDQISFKCRRHRHFFVIDHDFLVPIGIPFFLNLYRIPKQATTKVVRWWSATNSGSANRGWT
mmetsp:Transcript_15840/g.36387  ORF Transcript_15840/g.36387 Transcript_15840/m.36387 type:complete len:203 (+) Transcript_15840:678-1286(+)